MTELNGSSYYRANPFYQQGYIPDSAFKNRKAHHHGEIPQGEQFFQPTNKKHFQRIGYYSTIADQNIIASDDPQSPAKDKEYFRSLNIDDIEGATTNTLISKAVKNRIKAQQELSRRAQQQSQMQIFQKMRIIDRQEGEKKRIQALNALMKNAEPNYHELAKRMRTEERQKMTIKHQKSHQNQPENGTDLNQNNKQMQRDTIQPYREQLQQADRQIKQLEMQLSRVKSQKNRAKQDYQDRFKQPKPQIQHNQRNNAPVTYQDIQKYRPPSNKYPQESKNQNPEQYYDYSSSNNYDLSPQEMQYLAAERQRQQNQGMKDYRVPSRQQQNPQKSVVCEPMSGRQQRQQHRRINPTFLSYGSPSIGFAGKNIVGY